MLVTQSQVRDEHTQVSFYVEVLNILRSQQGLAQLYQEEIKGGRENKINIFVKHHTTWNDKKWNMGRKHVQVKKVEHHHRHHKPVRREQKRHQL